MAIDTYYVRVRVKSVVQDNRNESKSGVKSEKSNSNEANCVFITCIQTLLLGVNNCFNFRIYSATVAVNCHQIVFNGQVVNS